LSHFDTVLDHFILDGIKVLDLSSDCTHQRLDVTLSTTAPDGTHQPFVCSVVSLPDPLGQTLFLSRVGYHLPYGETGIIVPLVCEPTLDVMDLRNLDSIIGFQLS